MKRITDPKWADRHFIDALRVFLGLRPLYDQQTALRPDPRYLVSAEEPSEWSPNGVVL